MTAENEDACFAVEVVAGFYPGQPDENVSHSWVVPRERWEAATPEERLGMLTTVMGAAYAYAAQLTLQPERALWGRVEWQFV